MKYPLLLFSLLITFSLYGQALYELPPDGDSRLSSFENPNGHKGSGGKRNHGAKGNAFEVIAPGETKTLLDIDGQGTIQRIWMTIDQNPAKLRALRFQCYWDNAEKPAIDVPFGDFFGHNLGILVPFESELFSSGEGRSFLCYIPMPFRSGARVLLINEGEEEVKLFYDIDFLLQELTPESMYFHAWWNQTLDAIPGEDYIFLPRIGGKGRFLGVSFGVTTNPEYKQSWWGEGEIKMYIDGDDEYPTICGTGAEDYVGSAWGLGTFINRYQGCTIADQKKGKFNMYRWHIPDKIFFREEIKVTIQQIGGWMRDSVAFLVENDALLIPISVDGPGGFIRLLEAHDHPAISDPDFPPGWVNFYRSDDYTSVSYFYLDAAQSTLPPLTPLAHRKHVNR